MSDQARRGKHIISAILAAYFLIELLTLAFETMIPGFRPDLPTLVRLALAALLAWYLYTGRDWARWAWGILLLLGDVTGLVLGLSRSAASLQPLILLFSCLGLLYFLVSSGFLFLSPDVQEYINSRAPRSRIPGAAP